jgi:hypothetical protein
VFSEEQGIFRAQQLDLIYSQSSILYEIMPNVSRYTLEMENTKSNPHVDGILDSAKSKSIDLTASQMQKLVIQHLVAGPTISSTTPDTESFDVHFVKTKTPKGPQHLKDKRKGKGKKGVGDNNKSLDKNVEGEKDEKIKVKFPCNICDDDHLTHEFP